MHTLCHSVIYGLQQYLCHAIVYSNVYAIVLSRPSLGEERLGEEGVGGVSYLIE